jgi:hypothetical protein
MISQNIPFPIPRRTEEARQAKLKLDKFKEMCEEPKVAEALRAKASATNMGLVLRAVRSLEFSNNYVYSFFL